MLEGIMGSRPFAVFYVAAVFVGGLAVALWEVFATSGMATIGASGGVLAVIVGTAMLRPRSRVIFIMFPVMLWVLAAFYVGMDFMRLVSALKGQGGGVSFQAHLGGALFGALVVHKGLIWKDPMEVYDRWRAGRAAQQEVDDDQELDKILAKISKDGIHALSAKEKAFLNRSSQRKSG